MASIYLQVCSVQALNVPCPGKGETGTENKVTGKVGKQILYLS